MTRLLIRSQNAVYKRISQYKAIGKCINKNAHLINAIQLFYIFGFILTISNGFGKSGTG